MEAKEDLEFNHSGEFLPSILNNPIISRGKAIILFEPGAQLDYFSIPVIEKIHKIGEDYIKYVQDIIKVYYTPTADMDDFVLDYPFWKLIEKQFEGMHILQLREIITMVLFKLASYEVAGSCSKTKETLKNPEFKLLGDPYFHLIRGLKINKYTIVPFNSKYNIKTGVIEFNETYSCTLSNDGINIRKNELISVSSVNEIINHIKNGNLFVRVDIEEFSLCSKRVTKMISFGLKKRYSYGACILACFLLGCLVTIENNAVEIGIAVNSGRD